MNHVTVPAQDSGIDGLLPHGLCLLTLHLFRSSSSFPLTSCLSFVGFLSLPIISHLKSDTYPIYSVPLIIQWCRATSRPTVLLFSPQSNSTAAPPSRHLRGDHTTHNNNNNNNNNNGCFRQSLAELAISTVYINPLLAIAASLFVPFLVSSE